MERQEIEAVLARYADIKNRHDVDAIVEICTDDSYYESVPLGARVEGKEALHAFYSAFFAGLPDYRGDFDGIAYGEDSAVAWGRFSGTLAGEFMGVPVEAGRRVEVPVSFVCTFRDGLLAGDTGYFDAATLAGQLGLSLDSLLAGGKAPAEDFAERFAAFWRDPDPQRVPELVAPECVSHWPGAGVVSGQDYPAHIGRILDLIPDMRLEVTSTATEGDAVFIRWQATGTVAGKSERWAGIDNFRIRDGRAIEALIAFDSAPFAAALQSAAA